MHNHYIRKRIRIGEKNTGIDNASEIIQENVERLFPERFPQYTWLYPRW